MLGARLLGVDGEVQREGAVRARRRATAYDHSALLGDSTRRRGIFVELRQAPTGAR